MTKGDGAEPHIISRRRTELSPWFAVVEKEVAFPWLAGVQTFHAVDTPPYVKVYALTPELEVPLVRQYRPAVEKYTWELPAGLLDEGEPAESTCRRELAEETGLIAQSVVPLGMFDIDTGRAEAVQYVFLAYCGAPNPEFRPEDGIEVIYVPEEELPSWIESGRITSLSHIGAIHIAHSQRQREWVTASAGFHPKAHPDLVP